MNNRTKGDGQDLSRNERRKQETRRKLNEAALQLVFEKGYDRVTIQDIVDRADLGRGTFYVHYRDLQDILWDIIQDGLSESLLIGEARAAETSDRSGYLGYRVTFETAARHRDLYKVMLGSRGSSLITHRVADYLASAIQQSIEQKGYLSDLDYPPQLLAQYLVGALMRLVLWWLETPNEYSPTEMADMVFELIHRKRRV